MNTVQRLMQLRVEPSRKKKEAMLAAIPEDEIFWDVLWLTYNGFVMFNMTSKPFLKLDVKGTNDREEFLKSDIDLLESIGRRELTGGAAIAAIQEVLKTMTPRLASVMLGILDKDQKIGLTAKTINQVRKNYIPVFEAMLAHPFEEKRLTKDMAIYCQPKLDGMRVLAFTTEDNDIMFVSRNGLPVLTVDYLKPELLKLANGEQGVFDGEMLNGDIFNESISNIKRKTAKNETAIYHLFEFLTPQEFGDGGGRDYSARFGDLFKRIREFGEPDETAKVQLVPLHICTHIDEVMDYYKQCRNAGLEGVIVKHPKHLYERKRSYSWLKIKNEETMDMTITGYIEGEGKYVGKLGAFTATFGDISAKVGGGFTDKEREEFWVNKDEMVGRTIEVEYHEITPDKSLRHPRYVKLRPDKD